MTRIDTVKRRPRIKIRPRICPKIAVLNGHLAAEDSCPVVVHTRGMRYGNILQMDDVVHARRLMFMSAITDIRVAIVTFLRERIEIEPARRDRAVPQANAAAIRIELALGANVQPIRL